MPEFIRNNQSIHYEIKGCDYSELKIPVLFLHGNGESLHIFDRCCEPLLSSRTFVMLDSRLQGESHSLEGGDVALSYETMADDAIALMQTLNMKEYDIVGYSDGGIVALLMAIKTYDVRKIIAIGTNINPLGLTKHARRQIRSKYRKAMRKKDVLQAELMRLMLEEPDINPKDFSRIFAETTVVIGSKDTVIDQKHSLSIADAIPRGSHMIIEGAGHDIPVTHPGILSDLIRTLL